MIDRTDLRPTDNWVMFVQVELELRNFHKNVMSLLEVEKEIVLRNIYMFAWTIRGVEKFSTKFRFDFSEWPAKKSSVQLSKHFKYEYIYDLVCLAVNNFQGNFNNFTNNSYLILRQITSTHKDCTERLNKCL